MVKRGKEEIEVVFLDIDQEKIEKQLKSIGAKKLRDISYRHTSFDYPDYRLDKNNSWIRLRDEGEKVVLAFKERIGVTSQDGSTNDEGMEEIEVIVNDYETTLLLLKKLGFIEKHEAEKRRSRWKKDEIIFDIDTWPCIPTLLEIEAPSWDEVNRAIKLLKFKPEDKKIFSVNQVYRLYNMDINDYQKIRFDGMVKKLKSPKTFTPASLEGALYRDTDDECYESSDDDVRGDRFGPLAEPVEEHADFLEHLISDTTSRRKRA